MKSNRIPKEISRTHYNEALRQAIDFVKGFSGDARYAQPKVNLVALESAILGWIFAQLWFESWRKRTEAKYPRTDVYTIVQDWAMEIASDVANSDYFV